MKSPLPTLIHPVAPPAPAAPRPAPTAVESQILTSIYNPQIKSPGLACCAALTFSAGLVFSPWAYNAPMLGAFLVALTLRHQRSQERLALVAQLSGYLDLGIEVVWLAVHIARNDLAARHAFSAALLLPLLCVKASLVGATLWRLRDEGYVFSSAWMAWESRMYYGDYFGDRLPTTMPAEVPVQEKTPLPAIIEEPPLIVFHEPEAAAPVPAPAPVPVPEPEAERKVEKVEA